MFDLKFIALIERLIAALEANTAAQAGEAVPKKTRAQKALDNAQAAPAPAVETPAADPRVTTTPAMKAAEASVVGIAALPAVAGQIGDMKELSPLITQLAKTRRDDAVAILKSFGAANARELKPEHVAPAIEKFKAALAAPVAGVGSDLV